MKHNATMRVEIECEKRFYFDKKRCTLRQR